MSAHIQRAVMLIQQSRFELAEKELRQTLAQHPDDAYVHSLLAICYDKLNDYRRAKEAAHEGIHLAPASPFSFYAASIVSAGRNDYAQADQEIQQAIALDMTNASFFAHLAMIKIAQKQWVAAKAAAEEGLALDPEHVECTNFRAIAMVKLGDKIEAGAAIEHALQQDPEDAVSHANLGWSLLERGHPRQAMPHFREALRLQPNMEWARQGIVEAMKSHYFIYRIMLNWFLWIGRLQGRTQWLIILGGFLGYQVVAAIAAQNPALQPFLLPLIVVYIAFVVLTWISGPLFNLILRFNQFGRLALSDEQVRTSNWVGACLALAVAMTVSFFVTGTFEFLIAAIASAFLMPVLATYYVSDPGWPRAAHALLALALFFVSGIVVFATIGFSCLPEKPATACVVIVRLLAYPIILMAIGSQFAVNYLALARPRKGTDAERQVWLIGGIVLMVAAVALVAFCVFIFVAVVVFEN